ncbi:uncharacterized protein RCO7_05901 [Rhynchosporium graminicola]|uniref:Uncharacterized protein n=1 Tax=Rhynchosporium graminicola TaxID=2792576 RepID=A0A1E1KAF8_9HELO|nr:uncharacterized protein RCO7_05901 [Rhynchosporium commune]
MADKRPKRKSAAKAESANKKIALAATAPLEATDQMTREDYEEEKPAHLRKSSVRPEASLENTIDTTSPTPTDKLATGVPGLTNVQVLIPQPQSATRNKKPPSKSRLQGVPQAGTSQEPSPSLQPNNTLPRPRDQVLPPTGTFRLPAHTLPKTSTTKIQAQQTSALGNVQHLLTSEAALPSIVARPSPQARSQFRHSAGPDPVPILGPVPKPSVIQQMVDIIRNTDTHQKSPQNSGGTSNSLGLKHPQATKSFDLHSEELGPARRGATKSTEVNIASQAPEGHATAAQNLGRRVLPEGNRLLAPGQQPQQSLAAKHFVTTQPISTQTLQLGNTLPLGSTSQSAPRQEYPPILPPRPITYSLSSTKSAEPANTITPEHTQPEVVAGRQSSDSDNRPRASSQVSGGSASKSSVPITISANLAAAAAKFSKMKGAAGKQTANFPHSQKPNTQVIGDMPPPPIRRRSNSANAALSAPRNQIGSLPNLSDSNPNNIDQAHVMGGKPRSTIQPPGLSSRNRSASQSLMMTGLGLNASNRDQQLEESDATLSPSPLKAFHMHIGRSNPPGPLNSADTRAPPTEATSSNAEPLFAGRMYQLQPEKPCSLNLDSELVTDSFSGADQDPLTQQRNLDFQYKPDPLPFIPELARMQRQQQETPRAFGLMSEDADADAVVEFDWEFFNSAGSAPIMSPVTDHNENPLLFSHEDDIQDEPQYQGQYESQFESLFELQFEGRDENHYDGVYEGVYEGHDGGQFEDGFEGHDEVHGKGQFEGRFESHVEGQAEGPDSGQSASSQSQGQKFPESLASRFQTRVSALSSMKNRSPDADEDLRLSTAFAKTLENLIVGRAADKDRAAGKEREPQRDVSAGRKDFVPSGLAVTQLPAATEEVDRSQNPTFHEFMTENDDDSCVFCNYESSIGIADSRVWLPEEASLGYCGECHEETREVFALWEDIYKLPHSSDEETKDKYKLWLEKSATTPLKELGDAVDFRSQLRDEMSKPSRLNSIMNASRCHDKDGGKDRREQRKEYTTPSTVRNVPLGGRLPVRRAVSGEMNRNNLAAGVKRTFNESLSMDNQKMGNSSSNLHLSPPSLSAHAPSLPLLNPIPPTQSGSSNSATSMPPTMSISVPQVNAASQVTAHDGAITPNSAVFMGILNISAPPGSQMTDTTTPFRTSTPNDGGAAVPSPTLRNASITAASIDTSSRPASHSAQPTGPSGVPRYFNAAPSSSFLNQPPMSLSDGPAFCRGCPWRQIDFTKAKICTACRDGKMLICSHAQHTNFRILAEMPGVFEGTAQVHGLGRIGRGGKFISDGRYANCMVCPGLATHGCIDCPLRLCGGCVVKLTRMSKGKMNELLSCFNAQREHIRNDSFLLRSDNKGF